MSYATPAKNPALMTFEEGEVERDKEAEEFDRATWKHYKIVSILSGNNHESEKGYISAYTLMAKSLQHAWHCFLRDEVTANDLLANGDIDETKLLVVSVEQLNPHPFEGQFLK